MCNCLFTCIRKQDRLSGDVIDIDALIGFKILVVIQHERKQAYTFSDSYYKAHDKIVNRSIILVQEFIENESDSICELKENEDNHQRAQFFFEGGSCLPLFLANLKHQENV